MGRGPVPSEVTVFVRSLPEKLTLGEMVERATEAGHSVSFAQVDSMRRQVGLRYTKRDGSLSKPYKNSTIATVTADCDVFLELRRLVVKQGCAQFRIWLDEIEGE